MNQLLEVLHQKGCESLINREAQNVLKKLEDKLLMYIPVDSYGEIEDLMCDLVFEEKLGTYKQGFADGMKLSQEVVEIKRDRPAVTEAIPQAN